MQGNFIGGGGCDSIASYAAVGGDKIMSFIGGFVWNDRLAFGTSCFIAFGEGIAFISFFTCALCRSKAYIGDGYSCDSQGRGGLSYGI